MKDNQEPLKPCPFCGGTKITIEWEPCPPLDATDTNRRWFAECCKCSFQGPFCQRETEVIATWNTRPTPSQPKKVWTAEELFKAWCGDSYIYESITPMEQTRLQRLADAINEKNL